MASVDIISVQRLWIKRRENDMKRCKWIPGVLLALCIAVVILPGKVQATIIDRGTCGAEGDNLTWTLEDNGVLTIQGNGEMHWYEPGQAPWYEDRDKIKSVIIDGATNVGASAFGSLLSLESVTIPDSVTSIGDGAFFMCKNLTSVTIPESVTYIGAHAFSWCKNLTSVTIPESVTYIRAGAFHDCHNLTSIIVPNGITCIENITFAFCTNLNSVTIPESVTRIESDAFWKSENLSNIYYPGNKRQWDAIKIRYGNDCLTNATIHYNSTGPESSNTFAFKKETYSVKTGDVIVLRLSCSTYNDSQIDDFVYNASDEDVVELSPEDFYTTNENGEVCLYVLGKKEGNAIITVTAPDGRTVSCNVKVAKITTPQVISHNFLSGVTPTRAYLKRKSCTNSLNLVSW